MKFILLTLAFWGGAIALKAQAPLGTVHIKDPSYYYNGGDRVFVVGFQGMKMHAACVDTDSGKVSEATFEKWTGERFLSSFPVSGKNYLFLVEQASSENKRGLFDDIKITRWDGKTAPRKQIFRNALFGSVIRYAMASDEEIYFLVDRKTEIYSEEEIYAAPHALLRYDVKNQTLGMIDDGLPDAGADLCSFWFPLRIGEGYTEWYRNKANIDEKKFIYEIKKLDQSGLAIGTREVTLGIPTAIPFNLSPAPYNLSNIFFDYDAFGHYDTTTKVQSISRLSFAPLIYADPLNLYYTTSKLTTGGIEGIYFMVLDSGLNLLRSSAYSELINNIDLINQVPKFSTDKYTLAFDEDADVYVGVSYLNFREKQVAAKNYVCHFDVLDKGDNGYNFEKLKSLNYPGFEQDKLCREKLKNVKPALLNEADFLYTGKGMLYVLPQKSDNVYFVKW